MKRPDPPARRRPKARVFLCLLLAAALCALWPAGVLAGGDQLAAIRSQEDRLHAQLAALQAQSVSTAQDLAAINTELAANAAATLDARRQLAGLTAQLAQLDSKLSQDQEQLRRADAVLGQMTRYTYEAGGFSWLGALMEASSFSDMLARLDGWGRFVRQQERDTAAVRAAADAVAALQSQEIANQRAQQVLLAQLADRQKLLDAQAAARNAAYASISAQQAQASVSLVQLDLEAQAILGSGGSSDPVSRSSGDRADLGRFQITAYALTGHTASGIPAGYGLVAVDPRLIPLGTRLWVEGYGNCLAADTGGSILGRHIDIWLPYDQALQWGIQYRDVQEYR